jgi:sulfite reductase (NADPH) hemoprotein beta-component
VRRASALRRNAMACVELPTCGLALAESERYLPSLVMALEERLVANGLAEEEIVIRMTGPASLGRKPNSLTCQATE